MSGVDVIVPCYRYAHYLRECVRSVLAQSIGDVRVLIIDDASPDDTAEVAADLAREDSRVIFSQHITNKGHIATYNEGIDWASGKYLLILSADDYLLPGALDRAVNLMDEHSEVGFTFGKAIRLEDSGAEGTRIPVNSNAGRRVLRGMEFIELSKANNLVSTPTAVVRTELQKRLGGYRPELPHSGDMEMWLRLAAYSSVGILEAYQAIYRRHARNMTLAYTASTANLGDLHQRQAALECFFQTCSQALPNPPQLRRKLFWSLSCEAMGFASEAFNDGEMESSKQILEFALKLCPEVKKSLPWAMFACKRRMGLGAWRALQPATVGIRQARALLRRCFGA